MIIADMLFDATNQIREYQSRNHSPKGDVFECTMNACLNVMDALRVLLDNEMSRTLPDNPRESEFNLVMALHALSAVLTSHLAAVETPVDADGSLDGSAVRRLASELKEIDPSTADRGENTLAQEKAMRKTSKGKVRDAKKRKEKAPRQS